MSMVKHSIADLTRSELVGKSVLVRVDFNVPVLNGDILDDSRIRAALPTINYIVEHGARCILVSHMGRPKGQVCDSLRLDQVAERLSELVDHTVLKLDDCIGDGVVKTIRERKDVDIFMLENVRFYSEEMDNDSMFAKRIAELGDLFVQDAFGAVHRAHASTQGVSAFLPTYAGFLVTKELQYLGDALTSPEQPFIAIVGGAKVSSKIGVLSHLLSVADCLVIGGAMAFTFLRAQGYQIGKSLCEEDKCDEALALLSEAKRLNKVVILPVDVVVSDSISECSTHQEVSVASIGESDIGVDIGSKSLRAIKDILSTAKTVIWNGPLGVFEIDAFSKGTCDVARYLAELDAVTIVGGGDSVAAVKKVGKERKMTHISTGGGACLEYLEGKVLPGVACIGNKV